MFVWINRSLGLLYRVFFYSQTVSFLEKRHLFYSVLKTLLRYCSERVVRHKKPSMGIYIPLYLSNSLDAFFAEFPNFELIFSLFSPNLTTVSTSNGLQLLENMSEPFLEVCKSSYIHFILDSRHQISRNCQKIMENWRKWQFFTNWCSFMTISYHFQHQVPFRFTFNDTFGS